MQLGDLLNESRFGLRLLEDPGDAATRPVERVFSTDQPLPHRYMSGGELVLTGLIFHSGNPAESDAFVASAVEGGVVAIGAGLDRFGDIPGHLRVACRTYGVPLFSVPEDVSFADITQEFIDRAAATAKRVRASLARSRELLTAVAAGRALDDIAARVVTATEVRCWVLTASGKRVAAVGPALAEQRIDALLAAASAAASLPVSVDGFTVLPVGGRADRTSAWYLVLSSAAADVPSDVMEAFGELAAIAALIRARNSDATFVREADDDATIARLLAGDVHDGGVAVVVRCSVARAVRGIVRDAMVAAAGATIGVADDDVVVHLPVGTPVDEVVEELRRHLLRIAPMLDAPLRVGVSEEVSAGGLGGAVRSARHAAEVGDGEVSVTHAASLGSAATLLSRLSDEVREDFAARVLGPIRSYDERTSAGLLSMLREFLAQGGSWVRTADALHLHPNTVRYRIAKVEELTGRDLATVADRVDIHLALTIW